jgi:hypothetical protein
MKRALLASLAAFGVLAAPTIATATSKTDAKVTKSEKKKTTKVAAKNHKAATKPAAKSN